jgi:tyrosyl-tRNA synthetase
MPTVAVTDADLRDGKIDILGLLTVSGLTPSRSEARRAVEQGGVTVDDEKVTDIKKLYAPEDLAGDGIVLRRGKKSYKRVTFK